MFIRTISPPKIGTSKTNSSHNLNTMGEKEMCVDVESWNENIPLFFAVNKDLFSGQLQTISYFDFETLKKATKNFHPINFLGSGGFGPVYQVWDPYSKLL